MLTIEDEDNPLAALIKRADQEGQKNNDDNDPIVVFNEEDNQDNGPITLSLRQPSFSHLTCGNLVPKGGIESISKSNEKFASKMNEPLSKKNSSSYANIKITIDQNIKDEVQGIKNTNKESHIDNNSNPILVLTGNNDIEDEENDESNVPIGLSVRQPSFASLCNHIIPKGGLESGDIPILIEEEPKNVIKPNETKDNNNKENNNINSNPVIVLTGNDENVDDEDDEETAPIGLSVRQPSFVSLCNHIIPKGGTETGDMPIVIEEEIIETNENESNDIDNEAEPFVLNVRQSSYANLHLGTQPPPTTAPDIEPIPDEEIETTANKNTNQKSNITEPNKPSENQGDTIMVLTENENEDDNAPIGLSVRQPSFASLTGNIIPKGGFQSTVPTITEETEISVPDQEISDVDIDYSSSDNEDKIENSTEQNKNESGNNTKTGEPEKPEMKDKILSSLLSINKEWWEEIGYKPPDNLHSIFKRNCSMFNVPTSKIFMKSTFGSSSSNDTTDSTSKSNVSATLRTSKRPSQSLYQGQLNKLDDLLKDGDSTKTSSRIDDRKKATRGPSIYRVNSYGNKTELIEVEVPIKNEEEENQNENEKLKDQNEFNKEDETKTNQPEIQPKTKALASSSNSATTSNKSVGKGIKMSRGPSMQRVSSFGNASTLKVVEMPTITEDKAESQSQNQNQSTNEDFIREEEYEEEEEEEEELNHDIPPEILKMMPKPRDPIVYSALCGASINGYKRDTVHRALTDLKSLLKRCQDRELEAESEFLMHVIDTVRLDAAADDPYFEVEEQMRDTEIELQSKLSDWQNMYEELDEEYKVQMEECEQRYQDDLISLEKEFHTTTTKADQQPPKAQKKKQQKKCEEEEDENNRDSEITKTEDNGITVIDDSNPLYSSKKSNQTTKKRHSSLTPNRLTILSPSLAGKKSQKPQQRSKAAVYSSTAPRKPPILQPSTSPSVSPDAAKMKQKVLKMIKAQRFEESFELSLKYYKKQMIENQKQVNKRSQAFLAAKTALKQKHEDEKKEIDLNFQAKRDEFTKKREQSLVPLRQQIIQLKKMKILIEEGEKNEKFNETMQPRLRASRTRKGRVVTQSLPPLSRTSNA